MTHTSRRMALIADILLFSVAIFWGGNFVFIKSAVERTSAIAGGSIVAGTMLYLLLRYVVATGIFAAAQPKSWLKASRRDWKMGGLLGSFYLTALVLQTLYLLLRYVVATGIFAAAQPKSWLKASRRDWKMGGLLGSFYLTALVLQTIGLQRTSPGVSGFITGMSVAMVPLLYWVVARRSPGRWQIIGAIVATIGLGALSLQGDFSIRWGDAITLLATLFLSLILYTSPS